MGSRRRASTSDNKPDMASSHSPRISRRIRNRGALSSAMPVSPAHTAITCGTTRAVMPGRRPRPAGCKRLPAAHHDRQHQGLPLARSCPGASFAHLPLPTRGASTLPTASNELVFKSRPRHHRKRRSEALARCGEGCSAAPRRRKRQVRKADLRVPPRRSLGRPEGSARGGVRNDRSDRRQAA